jgi:hypothetical protein
MWEIAGPESRSCKSLDNKKESSKESRNYGFVKGLEKKAE